MHLFNHDSLSRLCSLSVKPRSSGIWKPKLVGALVLAFLVANPAFALGPRDFSQPDYEAVLTKERQRWSEAERKANEAEALSKKMAAELKKLKAEIESSNVSSNVITIQTCSSVSLTKVTIGAGAHFPFGRSSLSKGAKDLLTTIKENITDHKFKLEVIILVGYADENEASNQDQLQKLSQSRAEAAKSYLVSLGITSDRIYTEGKGTIEPYQKPPLPNKRLVLIEVIGTR